MRKELHVSHIPQPPKPVTIPLSSKKKTKKKARKKQKEKNQKKTKKKTKKTKKQNKKKTKKTKKHQKQELRMRIFLGYHMDRKDRNVTYIFIRTQSIFRLSGW